MSGKEKKQRLRGYRLISDEEIIQLLESGHTQQQIADLKQLCKSTISHRVKRLRQKTAAEAQKKAKATRKALVPLKKDWQKIAGNPGAIFDTTILTRVNILQKQLEAEAQCSEAKQAMLHDRIMKTCDSLDKATVQVIQTAETLRFRRALEELEQIIIEVFNELDEPIRSEILDKFNRRQTLH